ncbi:response regulator transcription factor [Nevskia sp.]|uniref:response regulator transcription factor n=1 Tax=Nevskia sp. TaxID=1929292 RepID=UPI0025F6A228|nr:response regulator transcription factor [Nevskia sp.]
MQVLLVEDDGETRDFIARGLREAGHQVTACATGQSGLIEATGRDFDAIVLDRMLPGIDGLALLRMLRAGGRNAPVLMLTALGSIADRVEGLESGADDYLVKPFAFSELAARLQALTRRPAVRVETHRLVVGDLVVDELRRSVERAGQRIVLQPREFSLLAELMRNPGRIMTRTMLLERVWDFDFDPKTNIVETHLSRLRAKLNDGFEHDPIETVRGAGYRLRVAD